MALDGTMLGRCASEQMEALENDYGEDEDVRVNAVMTIVEIVRREGEEEFKSFVRVRHNVPDTFRAIGLLRAAENQVIG
jgi:hypothetical protein